MGKMLRLLQRVLNKFKGKFRVNPQVENTAEQLFELANSLELSMSGVEENFLDLGQKCQSIFSKTDALKSQVLKTAEFSSSKVDGSGLSGIGDLASKSVQKLSAYQSEIINNLKVLNSGCGHLQKLSNMCSNTDKMALLLNVIALNIAIESNRSEKAREMFMVFVTEVKELSGKVSHVSEDLFSDSETTRKKQIQYQQEISDNLSELQQLTGKAETVVQQSVQKIEELLKKSFVALKKAGECSNDIYSMVSSIIIAMQFHDIVRQQIEHVVTAIKDAEKLCANATTNQKGLGITGKVHSILILQNAQIKSAIAEIDSVYQDILKAFEGIEAKVIELLSCVSGSNAKDSENKADSDSFSLLFSGFENLNKLMTDADRLNKNMAEATKDASTATTGLLKHVDQVQTISLDLQRKALNAIIKAAHLGEMGRALEVFAQEVTTASDNSNIFAEKVVAHIESISSLTTQMSTTSDTNNLNSDLDLSLTESINRLSRSYDDFLEDSEMTSDMSRVLEQSITETKSALSFISDFSDELKNHLSKSEDILDNLTLAGDFNADGSDLSETSDRYTMESERLVHLSLFGEKEPESEQPDSKDEPELFDDESELFDDGTELFEDEPKLFDDEPEELPDSESLEKELSENIPPEETARDCDNGTPESELKDDDEFDDNIELF